MYLVTNGTPVCAMTTSLDVTWLDHTDLGGSIVSKKDFPTSFKWQKYLIA